MLLRRFYSQFSLSLRELIFVYTFFIYIMEKGTLYNCNIYKYL